MSRDAWEGDELRSQSMNGWSYVEGNPVNFIDPFGYFKCDPLTGECDRGYGLCVVQGQWRGSYVNGKPCIVDPANVQTGGPPPSPPPPLTPPRPSPGNPSPPLPPNGGCSSPNSTPTKPVRVRLPNTRVIPTELILFPPGTSHVIQANINNVRADLLSWIGFAADIGELFTLLPQIPSVPDIIALGDVGVTAAASYYSGETYLYRQPHSTLPPMAVIGQDVIFTSGDTVGAILAKTILPVLGFDSGGIPGGMLGYVGGQVVDVGATIASVVYDGSRLLGVPTYFSYALLWEQPPVQAILIHAQD